MTKDSHTSEPVCSFIIPFYNEGTRVLSVLSVVRKIALPIEVICVDDGSTDRGAQLIKKQYPKVTVLRNAINQGKSAAISKGASFVRGKYVFLLDADLQNLSSYELTSAIELIVRKPEIDMIILRRRFDPFFSKVVRGDVLVSGERILKTKDLLKILKTTIQQYEIEPAINRYMMKKRAHVRWFFHSGTNVPKTKKLGLIPGIQKELRYFKSVLAYHGLKDYVQTVMIFCQNDVYSDKETKQNVYMYHLKQMFIETFREDFFQLNHSILDKKRLHTLLARTKKQRRFLLELMRDI